jgi:hypothetical protein
MSRALVMTMTCTLLSLLAGTHWAGAAEDPRIAYAPDILGVDRMFLVALNVPQGAAELAVSILGEVEMFDRTPLPAKSDQRRYYFRTLAPTEGTEIVFDLPDGELVIPLVIWSTMTPSGTCSPTAQSRAGTGST